jgi:ABC-type glycerol-3-phosphate transport system substrate-binding protein
MHTAHISRRRAIGLVTGGGGAIAVGLLASACSPSASPVGPATAAPAATAAPTTAPAQTGAAPTSQTTAQQTASLSFTNLWNTENNTHYQGMQYLYQQFKAKHPEITINDVQIPTGDLIKKEKADCAAGACADILHDLDGTLWTSGYLLDLTPYLDSTWKAQFDQGALNFGSTEGHYWGLPTEVNPMDVIWNTKILDDAGVKAIPATWDDLLAACDKIKKLGKTPTSWATGGSLQFDAILASQKGGLDALKSNTFDAPPIQETLKRMKVFVDNKWLPDNDIELTSQQAVANFLGEQVAFYMDGAWTIKNNILSAGASPDLKSHVKFSAFPGTADSGGPVVEMKVATMNGVAKKVEQDKAKLDAAITFMKFWLSPEIAAQWIPLTWSPMGINVDMSKVTGLDPLPTAFLDVQQQAKMAFTLPATKTMVDHQWDHPSTAMQTLLTGKSADDALKAYVAFLKA